MRQLGPYFGRDGVITAVLLMLLVLAPIYASLAVVLAQPASAGVSMVSGFLVAVGAMLGRRYRLRDYWALTHEQRRWVTQAVADGTPTRGEPFDNIALRILSDRAQGYVALRLFVTVVMLLALAPPIIASMEVSALWIVADLPLVLFIYVRFRDLYRDPRPKLRSLSERMS